MFNRLMMTIRSNLNDMISNAEDPEKVLNQVIIDMQTQLVQAKKQVAIVIAGERRLYQQAADASGHSAGWERKAMLAINAGDDTLARAALARKGEFDDLAKVYNEQWQAQKKSGDTLRFALNGLASKIDEAHRTRHVLIARQRRAQAQHMIAQTLTNMNVGSPLGALQRMEERIVQAEAEAEAAYDLSGQLEPSLEAQFLALESGARVNDELSALKQRMGLSAAPADPHALNAAARN